jgi:hypothetical protein
MKMVLPLHYYDENGRVKPPLFLMLSLVFLARSIVVFIASLSFREDGGLLLSVFYPDKYQFYLTLASAIPSVALLLFIGFRERIWKAQRSSLFIILPFALALILIYDLCVQLYIISQQHFVYSWPMASTLLITLVIIWYLMLSKTLRILIRDWRARD